MSRLPPPSATAPWPRRRFTAALGALSSLAAWPAAAQFRVEIAGVGATQIPIAIATLRDERVAGVAVSAIVRDDLERSGLFRVLRVDDALDERSTVDLPQWRARGADALVAGSVSRLVDGRYDVRYKMWDAVRNEELLGQSKVVPAAELRLAAHRTADEIYRQLTGERGVFATRIAYVSKGGGRYALHVADADGQGGQVALTSAESIISPAWSPDGRQLAYVSFESGKAVVWTQDLTSGARRRVADQGGFNSAPAWSPDGSRLVVTMSQGGVAQLYTLPASGGTPTRLTNSGAIDTEAVWAPDGRRVYFVSDRGGGPQVYRVDAGGGTPERVTFDGGYNISPTLSPDGRTMVYVTRQGSALRLMALDVESGAAQPISDTSADESPSFAPNGRLVVYATRAGGADVLMTTTLDGRIKTRLLGSGADLREPAWGPFGR